MGAYHDENCIALLARVNDVDMNLVMTESGKIIEIQGTAEKEAFTKDELDDMLSFGAKGIKDLIREQYKALGVKK